MSNIFKPIEVKNFDAFEQEYGLRPKHEFNAIFLNGKEFVFAKRADTETGRVEVYIVTGLSNNGNPIFLHIKGDPITIYIYGDVKIIKLDEEGNPIWK